MPRRKLLTCWQWLLPCIWPTKSTTTRLVYMVYTDVLRSTSSSVEFRSPHIVTLLPQGSSSFVKFDGFAFIAVFSRPWPYIDSLDDQDNEDVIDAKILNVIGSCGHDNCEDCKLWTAYPQSL